jgi:hypothetical protein
MSYIQALVVQKNNDIYLNGGISPGELQLIPTPSNGGFVFGDYWAVPVTDGIVSGFQYIPTVSNALTKPDPQAFHVVRIQTTAQKDDWYVFGNSVEYMDASRDAECCTSPGLSMPTAIGNFVPCQNICADSLGVFTATLGLPTIQGGKSYLPQGYFNGVALTAPNPVGYTTTAALLVFLNANWLNGNLAATWAVSADHLTLTNTLSGGDSDAPDVLCAAVTAI